MAMWKRPESVLVVVYTGARDVLLLRRSQPADYWQSVTGSLEPDESPMQAAVRELREETGLTVPVEDCQRQHRFLIHPAWRHRYAPDVMENLEHVFRARLRLPSKIALTAEHREYRWATRQVALRLLSSATNRTMVAALVPASS